MSQQQPGQGSDGAKVLGAVGVGVVVVIVGIVVIVGVLATLAIYGVRKYIAQAKTAEGMNGVNALARGIVTCAEKENVAPSEGSAAVAGGLPPTASPVPASLSQVAGKKYMSSPAEWSAQAYKCADFQMTYPQYFQYQWERLTPTSGRALAKADLDGDGRAEVVFEVPITCTDGRCTSRLVVLK